MNITKYDAAVVAAVAGISYGIYRLVKYNMGVDEEIREAKRQFEQYRTDVLDEKDYRSLIRQASTFNPHLDAHQRNVAFDMLNSLWYKLKNTTSRNTLDADIEVLNVYLDILMGDDETAILATLDREIRAEESRKIKAQREHELALAKAAGEKEIEVARIAAEAETDKARLYSEGIKGAANLLKAVKKEDSDDECNEESED